MENEMHGSNIFSRFIACKTAPQRLLPALPPAAPPPSFLCLAAPAAEPADFRFRKEVAVEAARLSPAASHHFHHISFFPFIDRADFSRQLIVLIFYQICQMPTRYFSDIFFTDFMFSAQPA